MILTNLTLTNFGVFRGRQSLLLRPEHDRPIILVGGKNGAGKTTILEAIRLCFYGQMATAARTKDEYLAYLGKRIHHNPGSVIQPSVAAISVEFQYSDIEDVHTYRVTRMWERRSSGKISESLSVERNGKPLDDIGKDHWADFVRDLLPPGISQLFFFDGERIQHLADDDVHQEALATAIKGLLGLDVIQRLHGDLNTFRVRSAKASANGNTKELGELESQLAEMESGIAALTAERQQCEAKMVQLQSEAAGVQERIKSQGGAYARGREKLVQQRAKIQAELQHAEGMLRELAAGLLPFSLVPDLCQSLKQKLLEEEAAGRLNAGQDVLQATKHRLLARIVDPVFWTGLPAGTENIKPKLLDVISTAFDASAPSGSAATMHGLSPVVTGQLVAWIDDAIGSERAYALQAGRDLEKLTRELDQVEANLRKIPPDEVLHPLLAELHQVHQQIGETGKQLEQLQERIAAKETERAALQRRYEKLVETISAHAEEMSRIHLIPKLQKVLDEYESALLCNRVMQLQELVGRNFDSLSRKANAIKHVTIDPRQFHVSFTGRDGQMFDKSSLSAGEKQVYAISMLWALAQASQRPLPLVVDTPLGRLDSEHRWLLTEKYFPIASHQVIILSTDTEFDQSHFEKLRPRIARTLRLEFDCEDSGTRVLPGYFWNEINEDTTHNRSVQ